MAPSVKAQEIQDYIVGIDARADWTDRAKAHLERNGQNESGPRFQRNVYAFVLELQAAFANKFSQADEHDWEEIADWLFSGAEH